MCECGLDLLMYLANGSGEVDVRKPAPPWAEGRSQPLQFCPFICLVCCLLLHSVHPLAHLLSNLSAWQPSAPMCPDPRFTLAKYERGDHSVGPAFACLDQ